MRLILFVFSVLYCLSFFGQAYNQVQKVVAQNRSSVDGVGIAIDVLGDYCLVGVPGDEEDENELNPLDSAGSAFVLQRQNDGQWLQTQKLLPSNRSAEGSFGARVLLNDNFAYITAPGDSTDSIGNNPMFASGALYIYERTGGLYTETRKIVPQNRHPDLQYGTGLDISGDWMAVAASRADAQLGMNMISNAGAVYLYKKNAVNGEWEFQQIVYDPVPRLGDDFGVDVSIDNDLLVVGARREDYDETESNPLSNAGAAYVYRLNAGVWNFEQKLVEAGRSDGDSFGFVVDVLDNKIGVGAPDKQVATGSGSQGFAYVYAFNGTSWVLSQPRLEYPNSNVFFASGAFGFSLEFNNNSLFVGAPADSNPLGDGTIATGSVFKFDLVGSTYLLDTEILATPRNNQSVFGSYISLDSNKLFVGALAEQFDENEMNPIDTAGAIYIFEQCIQSDIPLVNSSSTSICAGDSLQLTIDGVSSLNSATEWYWYTGTYGSGTLVDSTDTVWVKPTATTTYSIVGEGGCVQAGNSDSVRTITITVNTSPTVTASASPSASICVGDMVTLTGSGANTYVWDNGVVDGTAFTPASTATYKVVGTDSNGCKDSTTQVITVNTGPTISINYSGTSTICSGTSITLSGSGATNYSWNNGVQDGVAFTPVVTNTYTLTGDNGVGCPATIDTTITVISGPTVSASAGVTTICEGEQVTLNSSGANSYSWDNGLGNGQTQTVSPTVTTTYIVTGTQASTMCTDQDSVTITVNAQPDVTANAASNDSLCIGDDLTLTGGGANSYIWNNGVTDGVTFTPSLGAVTYEVTGTDINNCTNTASITVEVFNQPAISSSISPTGAICFGETVVLTGFGGVTYVWDSSGIDIGIVNGVAFAPSTGNNVFNLTAIDANGCSGTAIQSVNVNPSPNVGAFSSAGGQSLCEGDTLTLTGTGNAQTYSWDNGVDNTVAFVPGVGTTLYTVTGTSSNQCTTTASVSIVVNTQEDATVTPILPLCGGVPIQTLETVTPGGVWQGVGVNASTGEFDAAIAGVGVHEIKYTSPGVCNDSSTIFIEVYEELIITGTKDSVCFGDSDGDITLNVIQGVAPYSYLWATGETTSSLSDLGEGVYSAEVTDANNCKEEIDVPVELTEICDYHEFLPNVFSPNGDGVNDVLFVRGKGFSSLLLVIFDRWGNKIFETTDKDIGWDGTNNGNRLTSDVYIYHLEGEYFNGEKFERDGDVLLAY